MTIIYAFVTVGVLALLFGLGLAFASRALAVQKDERVEAVEGALPGLNCGACGHAGCAAYAEAVAKEGERLDLCGPGGSDVVQRLGEIMGVTVDVSTEKWVTQVHCRGGEGETTKLFDYHGLADCNALYQLYGGNLACKEGCLGLGSCMKVCPVDAIDYDAAGKVWVDRDRCISCGKCVDVCPTGVMQWIPYSADYIVACNNHDGGKKVRGYCAVGCIACGICEKKSPDGGYRVNNDLARIDFAAVGDRSAGARKCPMKCIVRVSPERVEQGVEQETPQALQTESAAVESDTAAAADTTLSPDDRSANRDANDQS